MNHLPYWLIPLALSLPPVGAIGAQPAGADQVTTQKVPFLGTATTQSTAQQRLQAGLPDGVGLTVQHVLKGSPAEGAGLQPYDVLHKANDQLLINDPQFRVLLRTFRPGERIALTFVRQARSRTITVQLGGKEVPAAEVPPRELLQWLLRPASGADSSSGQPGFSASYEDDEHVLVLTTDDQGKHLLAKSRQGAVLFDGLVNTQQERQAVPEALQAKLNRLETPPKPQSQPPSQQ
jgi:hypothetical protein